MLLRERPRSFSRCRSATASLALLVTAIWGMSFVVIKLGVGDHAAAAARRRCGSSSRPSRPSSSLPRPKTEWRLARRLRLLSRRRPSSACCSPRIALGMPGEPRLRGDAGAGLLHHSLRRLANGRAAQAAPGRSVALVACLGLDPDRLAAPDRQRGGAIPDDGRGRGRLGRGQHRLEEGRADRHAGLRRLVEPRRADSRSWASRSGSTAPTGSSTRADAARSRGTLRRGGLSRLSDDDLRLRGSGPGSCPATRPPR